MLEKYKAKRIKSVKDFMICTAKLQIRVIDEIDLSNFKKKDVLIGIINWNLVPEASPIRSGMLDINQTKKRQIKLDEVS